MSAITESSRVHILATNEDEAKLMEQNVISQGGKLGHTTIWRGVVPPNSFTQIDEYTRMSTPEYFFLRKCAEFNDDIARCIGNELVGYYATCYTRPDLPVYGIVQLDKQRTTKARLRAYLLQCPDAPECQHALEILDTMDEGMPFPI